MTYRSSPSAGAPVALATLLAPLALLALLALLTIACRPEPELSGRVAVEPGPPRVLEGTHYDGTPFDLTALEEPFALVFFGFTSCPDVCPITLGNLDRAREVLGDNADRVAVVFASVDPPRDTLDQIGRYVRAFDAEAYGVRLDEQQLARTVESFGLVVEAQPPFDPEKPDNYTVDHTATLFLVDGEGRVVLTYPAYTDPALIAGDLHQLIDRL
ncbi:MAG: SCO family protein [Acidobacteria bacterium]|nr:MAG: SCO family protein [Acidobacteriota bacterium]REK06323.1 MAG: SCO family protein [Acidobacteriota bacterium]